jgi:hypothetical protein
MTLHIDVSLKCNNTGNTFSQIEIQLFVTNEGCVEIFIEKNKGGLKDRKFNRVV